MGGSDIRAIRDGLGAKAGVLSALLAQKGVIGDKTSIDGKYGLYNICFRGDSGPAKVTAELGKKFLGIEVSLKPWPCCRNIHGFIEASLKLLKEHGIKPDDVAEIIGVTGGGRKSYYEELDRRRKPKTSIDAKFSLPFVLGVAIAERDVLIKDFTAEGRGNPVALGLAQKVTYRFDERYKRDGIEIGLVEIMTKDGKKYAKEIPFAYGHPQNPIHREDLFKKFRDCAKYSKKRLPSLRIEKIIEKLSQLEKVKDMREVVKLLD
jgi:2-methylcitrate dehydratase PrpD